jgi:hypothetical protein
VALAYIVLVPRLAHADRHALYAGTNPTRVTLAQFIAGKTSGADVVAVDDLALADLAHRLVPPGLCDPSNVRLLSGYLTAREAIAQTAAYRARLVLPSFGIYVQLPEYLAWVRAHYGKVGAPLGAEAYIRGHLK